MDATASAGAASLAGTFGGASDSRRPCHSHSPHALVQGVRPVLTAARCCVELVQLAALPALQGADVRSTTNTNDDRQRTVRVSAPLYSTSLQTVWFAFLLDPCFTRMPGRWCHRTALPTSGTLPRPRWLLPSSTCRGGNLQQRPPRTRHTRPSLECRAQCRISAPCVSMRLRCRNQVSERTA